MVATVANFAVAVVAEAPVTGKLVFTIGVVIVGSMVVTFIGSAVAFRGTVAVLAGIGVSGTEDPMTVWPTSPGDGVFKVTEELKNGWPSVPTVSTVTCRTLNSSPRVTLELKETKLA